MSAAGEFSTRLEAVLARELPGFKSLDSCQQLTAGASQETYKITAVCNTGERQLALRRSPPTLAGESGVGGINLSTEAKLFQLAGEAGIPGPAVLCVLSEADGLGAGFLMDWLEGESLGQRIVRTDDLASIRPTLAHSCGQILGRIHALDWQSANLQAELPSVDPMTLVNQTWAIYRDLNVPVPMIDYSWRWLLENLPADSPTTLVHGDFRNGNLMVTPQGINAVLDWELAHIGDPIRDLGWLCVNSWRFGRSDLPVGGFGEISDLLAGYREVTGLEVSDEQLKFWQVFGSFWWAVTTLQMASTWRTGETPSLERPVIGRRSSEAQMDCVNLIIPGPVTPPKLEQSIAQGTQLPMPAEMLAGVIDFLKEEVAPAMDTRGSFLAKVSANSLQIAQRELTLGPGLAAAELQRLLTLTQQSADLDHLRWALVEKLRDDLALDTPGLAQHLRATVAGQLAIDQPRYCALATAG